MISSEIKLSFTAKVIFVFVIAAIVVWVFAIWQIKILKERLARLNKEYDERRQTLQAMVKEKDKLDRKIELIHTFCVLAIFIAYFFLINLAYRWVGWSVEDWSNIFGALEPVLIIASPVIFILLKRVSSINALCDLLHKRIEISVYRSHGFRSMVIPDLTAIQMTNEIERNNLSAQLERLESLTPFC